MRTAGQGQAAVPGERVRRRRGAWPAWAAFSGPLDKIPRTVTAVERYPDVFGENIRPANHGAPRVPWFFRANWAWCGPEKM